MTDRKKLVAELDAAVIEQSRCMGGVDPVGCVIAARRVSELRAALRDDPSFVTHLAGVISAPPRVPRRCR